MGTLISVNCPVCKRPYVLRVNLEQLRETRPRALCARCGQRFDLLELAERSMKETIPAEGPSTGFSTTGRSLKKLSTISERTPPPTRADGQGTQPGAYRATVDRDAVRRARLRTRNHDEIRRALALPHVQALRTGQRATLPPVSEELGETGVPSSPTVTRQVIADLDQPFPWLDDFDLGLDGLAAEFPDMSALLESLLLSSEK